MIARWPGRIQPDTNCGAMASILDIFPTLAALTGINLPRDRMVDGRDITGLLTGRETRSPHDTLYFYHHDELEGIRVGTYKYYRLINHYKYPVPVNKKWGAIGKGRVGEWPLLYDLDVDPGECFNLANNKAEIVHRMEGIMQKWERSMAKNPVGFL